MSDLPPVPSIPSLGATTEPFPDPMPHLPGVPMSAVEGPVAPSSPNDPPEPVLAALRAWPTVLAVPPSRRFGEMFSALHALRDEPYDFPEDPEAQAWTARVELLDVRREALPGRVPSLLVLDGTFAADLPRRLDRTLLAISADARAEVLVVVLRGGAGDPMAAFRAARRLRGAFAEVQVVVTTELEPAGSLFCMGATHLHLGADALLPPFDAPASLVVQRPPGMGCGPASRDSSASSIRAAFDAVRRCAAEGRSASERMFLRSFLAEGGLTAEALGIVEARLQRAAALASHLRLDVDGRLSHGDERVLAALSQPYGGGGVDLDRRALLDALGAARVTLRGPAVLAAERLLATFAEGCAPERMGVTWCAVPPSVPSGPEADSRTLLAALTAFTGCTQVLADVGDARIVVARPASSPDIAAANAFTDEDIPF